MTVKRKYRDGTCVTTPLCVTASFLRDYIICTAHLTFDSCWEWHCSCQALAFVQRQCVAGYLKLMDKGSVLSPDNTTEASLHAAFSEQHSWVMKEMVDHDLLFRILLHPRTHLNTSRIKGGLGWTTNAWISSVEGPFRPKWVRDCDPFTKL